jgi:predicted nucleic acid-binding protein
MPLGSFERIAGSEVASTLLYLDSSAIVKLVVPEAETAALRRSLRSWPERVSSVVARIEVERVARRIGGGVVRRAGSVLARLAFVGLDPRVVEGAGRAEPPELRTLDAIHLATALSLGTDLGALCAYDSRLAEAAVSAGIEVIAPS